MLHGFHTMKCSGSSHRGDDDDHKGKGCPPQCKRREEKEEEKKVEKKGRFFGFFCEDHKQRGGKTQLFPLLVLNLKSFIVRPQTSLTFSSLSLQAHPTRPPTSPNHAKVHTAPCHRLAGLAHVFVFLSCVFCLPVWCAGAAQRLLSLTLLLFANGFSAK